MSGRDFSAMSALYGRTGDEHISELMGATNALAAALTALRTNPTPDGAERIAGQLHAMHRSALQLITTLKREVTE